MVLSLIRILSFNISQLDWYKYQPDNIMDQKIIALVNQYQDAGRYSVTWDSLNSNGNKV